MGSRTRRGAGSSGSGAGRIRAIALALSAGPFVLLPACRSQTDRPDLAIPMGAPRDGAVLFEEGDVAPSCEACHTLSAAGWEGTVAPDLGSMQPGYERIFTAITTGPGAMPSYIDRLTDEQLRDVAAYVADQVLQSADG